ncbi:MAG: hypothetical protein ACP5JP_07930 [bacterium]
MEQTDIKDIALDFVNKLMAYKEPGIRENAFVEHVKKLPVDTLADIIMFIINRSYKKEEMFVQVSNLFTNKTLLKEALGQKGMYELMKISVAKGYKEFSILMIENNAVTVKREVDEPLPDPKIDGMPVGVRKTLSKSHNRDVIEKLLYDQEPSVIKVLINNPKITESDVIKIVSRRPNSEGILRTVYNNHRWKYRYRVQCSLAMNPYTPTDISLSILPELFSTDLLKIANDVRLSEVVRLQARMILEQGITL